MSLPVKQLFAIATRSLQRFHSWRWFWPTIAVGILVVSLPVYMVAAQLGAVLPSLKPAAILHNPVSVITKAASQVAGTIAGHNVSPSSTPVAGKPSSSPAGQALGASISHSGETATPKVVASATPVGAPGHDLILANSVLTIGDGTRENPYYHPWTTAYVASKAKLRNPEISGSRADIGVIALPSMSDCPYSTGNWCTVWQVGAERLRPEGSGVSYFTVTAQDEAGNAYSAQLIVKWPPIAYYKISNVTDKIGTGPGSLGGTVPAIILDFDLTAGPNFGMHQLTMTFGTQWPYDCAGGVPGYSQKVSYDGAPTHYTLSCSLVGDLNLERSAGGTAGVNITSDLFTSFQSQGASAPIPKW